MELKAPAIPDNVRTMLKLVAALAVASALVAAPLAALYCNTSGPAAMACCQQKASECNQPGANDDCCRTVPVDKGTTHSPSHVLTGKPEWTSTPAPDGVVPVAALVDSSKCAHAFGPVWHGAAPDLRPPPLFVLRV
jgi:hypothetical protein